MMGQFSQLNLWGQDAKPANPEGEWYRFRSYLSPSPRQVNRDKVWDTWRSRSDRMKIDYGSDDNGTEPAWGQSDNAESHRDEHGYWQEGPETHPATGLPMTGQYLRDDDSNTWMSERMPYTGWGSGSTKEVPHQMSFHGSTHTSWRKHSATEFVPLNQPIYSHQADVSLSRVHQLMDDREGTSDSRSARGLRKELPRMFKDRAGDYNIIDGNHRVTSDILAGRLFTEARVAYPHNGPSFEKTNRDIEMKKFRAQDRHGTEHYEGLNNLWNGRTADGEWTL